MNYIEFSAIDLSTTLFPLIYVQPFANEKTWYMSNLLVDELTAKGVGLFELNNSKG